MSRSSTLCLAASLVLVALPDARADDSAPAAATVVVHGDGDEAAERARTAWVQQQGSDLGVRFVSVEKVFPADESALAVGDAAAKGCESEPVTAGRLSEEVESGAGSILFLDYLEAQGKLTGAASMLPCLTDVPSPDVLGRLLFLRGVVAFYSDGEKAATRRFEQALLTSSFLQWDATYPPDVRPAFDRAVKGALSAETAFLSLSPGVTAGGGGGLWLDGIQVDSRTMTTTLYAGTHLLQRREPSGTVESWVVEVEGGDSITLLARPDAVRALLAGEADLPLTGYAAARVLAPVEHEAGSHLVVADDDELVLFHRFEAAGQAWRLADLRGIEDWRASGRRMRGAGTGILVGGATALVSGIVTNLLGVTEAAEIERAIFPDGESGKLSDLTGRQASYTRAQGQARLGMAVAITGGVFTAAGVPLTAVGSKRARALSLPEQAAERMKTQREKRRAAGSLR